jgi:hypothetical protein
MTHAAAVRTVRGSTGRSRRKVANNTWAEIQPDGSVTITLHRTAIVTIHPGDSITLNSGGWRTVTTKARMNDYVGNRIFQKRGDWFVTRRIGEGVVTVPYHDGMTLAD